MTPRSRTAQRIIRAYGSKVVVECMHCHNYHHTAALDGYIEQVPCQGSDSCTAMLCSACGGAEEDKCGLCGLRACADHMKLNYDAGAGNGSVYARICDICVAKLQEPPPEPEPACPYCGETGGEPVHLEGRPMSRWYNGEEGDPGEDDFDGCTLCDPRKPKPESSEYYDPAYAAKLRQESDEEDCPW